MKKLILVSYFAFILVFSLMILSGCSGDKNNEDYIGDDSKENGSDVVSPQFLIATCPTTYAYLQEINMNDKFIVQTDSTAEALNLLRSNSVQIAFVGRNAYEREVRSDIIKNDVFVKYTIVSKTNSPLLLSTLQAQTIYTYLLDEEILEINHSEISYLNFNYVNKGEINDDEFRESFFLVPWSDFDELSSQGFNLIGIYSGASKVDFFRNPTFYYSKQYEKVVEQISQAILQE